MIEGDWLASRAAATPQKTAVLYGPDQWSYADLERWVGSVCGRLLAAGVTPGQHVGVLLPNTPLYVCLVHALARLGVVLVPLNTRLTTAELAWQVRQANCALLLAGAAEAKKLGPAACPVVTVDSSWQRGDEAAPVAPVPGQRSPVQAVVFTSGTSGRPKGAMLTFANHFYSAMASAYHLGTLPHDLWLSCLPLYHVGGLAVVWRSCLYGTAVDLHPRFDLAAVNQALDSKPVTLISLVPTMLARLLEARDHWPPGLRLALIGGAAASPALVARALAAGVPVATTYGLTEAASQVATMLPAGVRQKPGSVGRPLLFTGVTIVDDSGQPVPAGAYGEIVVTGPTVMAGYYEGETPALLPGANTFHTGDIGYLDADGDLWLVQRRSDLIVSGGENVYPAEVEAVLKGHPAVEAACVVGVPDVEWGQAVMAMVVLRADTAVTAVELAQHCRTQLAGYKTPRQIIFRDHLPLTASGKIARQRVAQQMASSIE